MGIDLEALANEMRAAGWIEFNEYHPLTGAMFGRSFQRDDMSIYATSDGRFGVRETNGGRTVGKDVASALAIIARHLGAGQPVAADRAELVDRVKADIEMFLGDWLDASYGPYDQLAKLSVSAVEAAGWGPRAEPVAPPEPLSAGEPQGHKLPPDIEAALNRSLEEHADVYRDLAKL